MAIKYIITGLSEDHGGFSWPDLPVLVEINGGIHRFVRGGRALVFDDEADAMAVCSRLAVRQQIIEIDIPDDTRRETTDYTITQREPTRPVSKTRS